MTTVGLLPLDDIHILFTKPPHCVLFRSLCSRSSNFGSLDDGPVPIFPITRSITIKNCSIRHHQVPICAAFCLFDYKIQGRSLTEAVLDLTIDDNQNLGLGFKGDFLEILE